MISQEQKKVKEEEKDDEKSKKKEGMARLAKHSLALKQIEIIAKEFR